MLILTRLSGQIEKEKRRLSTEMENNSNLYFGTLALTSRTLIFNISVQTNCVVILLLKQSLWCRTSFKECLNLLN